MALTQITVNRHSPALPLGYLSVGRHPQFDAMAHELASMARELEATRTRLRDTQVEAAMTLALTAESRNSETGSHLRRIATYGAEIARELRLPPSDVERYRLASPLHDIGKIAIPDAILEKPGRLTADEFHVMQQHTQIGARLFDGATSPILRTAAEICRSHHERWDGSGYPNRLRRTEIPLFGRILAVVDVFDALVTRRCYKPAWTFDAAFDHITQETPTSSTLMSCRRSAPCDGTSWSWPHRMLPPRQRDADPCGIQRRSNAAARSPRASSPW